MQFYGSPQESDRPLNLPSALMSATVLCAHLSADLALGSSTADPRLELDQVDENIGLATQFVCNHRRLADNA